MPPIKAILAWIALAAFYPWAAAALASCITLIAAARLWLDHCAQRLAHHKAAEDDPFLQRPFVHHARAPITHRVLHWSVAFGSALTIIPAAIAAHLLLVHALIGGPAPDLFATLGLGSDLLGALVFMGTFFLITEIVARFLQRRFAGWAAANTYGQLKTLANAIATPHDALDFASSLRFAAKMHVRTPYDLYRIWSAITDDIDHSAYYRSERLIDTLTFLQQHFPHDSEDDAFRQRYWAYAQSITAILRARDPALVDHTIFALPLPKSRATLRAERLARLQAMRTPRPPHIILDGHNLSREQALAVIGLSELPEPATLAKLRAAFLDDPDPDIDRVLMARAFERLAHSYV